MSKPRVIVFGYSEVGYQCLELLLRRQANIVAVFTHADNPTENHWFRSVADLARQHQVPVFTPETLSPPECEAQLRTLAPDLMFSFYYRKMIPSRLLDLAPLGAFNMHGSYLPKYRGKAPVNWAVLQGATQIGATLHYMVKRADAGDIVDQEAVPIGPEETAAQIMEKVQQAAIKVLERQLDNLLAGRAPRHPQDESQATYFSGRKPEDGRIQWTQPATVIFNLVRAVTRPYPGAFTDLMDARMLVWWARPLPGATSGKPGEIVRVNPLTVATGQGLLEISDAQWVQRDNPAQSIPAPALQPGQCFSDSPSATLNPPPH
ncbi:MAG: formyltransferase [Verrucomicrobiota bacterium]